MWSFGATEVDDNVNANVVAIRLKQLCRMVLGARQTVVCPIPVIGVNTGTRYINKYI